MVYLGIVSPGKATDPLFTEVNGLLDADGKIKEEFKTYLISRLRYIRRQFRQLCGMLMEMSYAMDSNNKFNNENALKIWSAIRGLLINVGFYDD